MVYELNHCPRNPANHFPLKNCLFGTFKLVRNVIKSNFTFNRGRIAFNWEISWSFDNDSARNVVIFVLIIVRHLILIIQKKKNFLVLGEGTTFVIKDSHGAAEKN